MNPFTMIGFLLVVFYVSEYVNAIPIASDETNLAVAAQNSKTILNNTQIVENLLHNVNDVSKLIGNNEIKQTEISSTTRRPSSTTQRPKQKPKTKGQIVKIVRIRKTPKQHESPPPTEKPNSLSPFPSIWMTTGWGH